MASCSACGQDIRWVEVEGEGRIALDSIPEYNGRYSLDPHDVTKANAISRPGQHGYLRHSETCPRKSR